MLAVTLLVCSCCAYQQDQLHQQQQQDQLQQQQQLSATNGAPSAIKTDDGDDVPERSFPANTDERELFSDSSDDDRRGHGEYSTDAAVVGARSELAEDGFRNIRGNRDGPVGNIRGTSDGPVGNARGTSDGSVGNVRGTRDGPVWGSATQGNVGPHYDDGKLVGNEFNLIKYSGNL